MRRRTLRRSGRCTTIESCTLSVVREEVVYVGGLQWGVFTCSRVHVFTCSRVSKLSAFRMCIVRGHALTGGWVSAGEQ